MRSLKGSTPPSWACCLPASNHILVLPLKMLPVDIDAACRQLSRASHAIDAFSPSRHDFSHCFPCSRFFPCHCTKGCKRAAEIAMVELLSHRKMLGEKCLTHTCVLEAGCCSALACSPVVHFRHSTYCSCPLCGSARDATPLTPAPDSPCFSTRHPRPGRRRKFE